MPLSAGTKLGPYEITSPLGAGGMGEVYRAHDTRLGREVAIKVLPTHLSENSDLRARFEREARTISGLQHPNICVLYDVGRQDSTDFLVMEYLEGETLAKRIARKPLTPADAIPIATEIADALDKAHRSGVTHRDLKPANVMLTKSGAKLMDFGLAKLTSLSASSQTNTPAFSAVATLPDMASPITVAGTIVGTVQYMSPEQIQGKEADARSDIFAFGVMLYEMLTGKRAFEGKSQLSVASAILEKDPDPITAVQPLTPPALEHLTRTCLAKDPDQRFQSAHDLKLQLEWIASAGSQVGAPAVLVSQRKQRNQLLAGAAALGWLAALAALFFLASYARKLTAARQLIQSEVSAPSGIDFDSVVNGSPVVSPDATRIALLGLRDNKPVVLVENLSTGKAEPLAGTESAIFPFWSPDSNFIGFFSNGKLRKIAAAGGPVQAIADAPDGRGGAWNSQGIILFAPNISGPLLKVSEDGGTPQPVTPAHSDDKEFTNRNPYFLPDGKQFLFVQRSSKDPIGKVYSSSLDGGTPKELLPFGSNVAFSNGYLFFVKDGTLTAQNFDPSALHLDGKSIPLAESIEYYNPRNLSYFSVSQNVLIYRQSAVQNRELVWLDNAGKELDHWGDPTPYIGGTYTPSAHAAVLIRQNGDADGNSLWLADTERKTITRATPDADTDNRGIVSTDGKTLFMTSTSGYHSLITQRSLVSSGKEETLAEVYQAVYADAQSADGQYLILSIQQNATGFDVYSIHLAGNRKLVPILNGAYNELNGKISPDNKWIAYGSNENGTTEVYVTTFPGAGPKWQVSAEIYTPVVDNSAIDWSPDGKRLYYRTNDNIHEVEVRYSSDKPEFSTPRQMFSIPSELNTISLFADGKRLLATRPIGPRARAPLNLALNWQHLVH